MSEPWSKMKVRCALSHNAEWGEYKNVLGYAGSLRLGSHRRVCSMQQDIFLACKQSPPPHCILWEVIFLPVLEMVLWKSPGIQHLHYIYAAVPKSKGKNNNNFPDYFLFPDCIYTFERYLFQSSLMNLVI